MDEQDIDGLMLLMGAEQNHELEKCKNSDLYGTVS